jgi:hypothetical protein
MWIKTGRRAIHQMANHRSGEFDGQRLPLTFRLMESNERAHDIYEEPCASEFFLTNRSHANSSDTGAKLVHKLNSPVFLWYSSLTLGSSRPDNRSNY